MPFTNITNVCTIAAYLTFDLPLYAFVDNNGRTMYIQEAYLLRILLEKLFTNCQLMPISSDNVTAVAGVNGMLRRSEVDFDLVPSAITEESTKDFNFTYPVNYSPLSFLTDKPEQLSNTSAVLDPFSYGLWIFLIAVLFLVALVYYMLTAKEVTFQKVLFNVFGNMLQQQLLRFALKKNSVRWLLFAWLLGSMVLGSSYKAALLSFLLAPTEFVIRDIPQLAKEANKHSVTCMSEKYNFNSYMNTLLESHIESWKAVGACLERRKNSALGKTFYGFSSKTALVIDMFHKELYKSKYFVSDDYFYMMFYGYSYSERFLHADRLNEILLRVQAAGLREKYYRDEAFFQLLSGNFKRTPPLKKPKQVRLGNLYGAFNFLMFGWGIALITFFAEIVYYKRKSVKKA